VSYNAGSWQFLMCGYMQTDAQLVCKHKQVCDVTATQQDGGGGSGK